MKGKDKNSDFSSGRRQFISKLCIAAAAGMVNPAIIKASSGETVTGPDSISLPPMPSIRLGSHRISRLICGSNPLMGYSYLGSHTDRQMKEYFTVERTVDFLNKCERAGITAHQSSGRSDYLNSLWESGSKLKIISLQSEIGNIRPAIESTRPIAIVHHGGVSDRLFAEGKQQLVHDFVKAVKDQGLMAGVSAHNPDVIKKIADSGWEVDLFMTCFYYLTRKHEDTDPLKVLPVSSYHFLKEDPERMTEVIRQVRQPCLAFKVLGAGRRCTSQEEVEAAFKYAFENIKPSDGVIVGMFPWYFDEITANVNFANEFGGR